MILYSKAPPKPSSITALTLPKLEYYCYMTRDEYILSQRIAHYHDFLEMLFITEGNGSIKIGGTVYQVTEGDIVVYNANELHDETLTLGFFAASCLGISNLCIPQFAPNHIIEDGFSPIIHCNDIQDLLYMLLEQFPEYIDGKNSPNDPMINHLIGIILSIVMNRKEQLNKPQEFTKRTEEICVAAKKYIKENYTTELTVDIIGKAVAVSPFHMSRVFKEYTGYSPMQYVTRLRLGKSQTLLVDTDMTVTEIAGLVGYNSSSAFNYAFQKQFGITPLEFRDIYR